MPTNHLLADGDLLEATRNGDDAAFTALYKRYNTAIEGRIRQNVRGTAVDVRDVSQQTWAQGYETVTSGREIESFFGYISTIAQRIAHETVAAEQPDSLDRLSDVGHVPAATKITSAEQTFFDVSLELITDSLRGTAEDTRQPYAKIRTRAAAIAQFHGFDTPISRPSNLTRRMLVEHTTDADTYELVTAAVRAQIVITGQATIPPPYDPEIAGLFTGWSVPDLEALLTIPARQLVCLVQAAVVFPAKPSITQRRALRARLTALSDAPGWATVARALERAWIAEWFEALAWADRTRECVEAEAERVAAASCWPAAADAAIRFRGQPLGRNITTPTAVNDRLSRLLLARR